MKRALPFAVALALAAGCTSTGERPMTKTLVDNGPPVAYAELLTLARQQATAATDAYYVNRWSELEELSTALERTARFLPRATDVPEKHKGSLAVYSTDLGKAAGALGEAAKAKDSKKVHSALEAVLGGVHQLRLDN